MAVEISVAVSFITSYLYNKLPRRRVDVFAEELQKNLAKKLSETWSQSPEKGHAQRSLRVSGRLGVDPMLLATANDCGLDISEVLQCLPSQLVLWIDPKEVTYRFTDNDPVQTLYCENVERDAPRLHFTPQASPPQAFTDLDGLQSRLAALAFASAAVSPHSVSPNSSLCLSSSSAQGALASSSASASASATASASAMQKSPSTPSFTAASFAQTKFGSVKMRNQNRRAPAITAADLARHQRAYSSNSAVVPKTNGPAWLSNQQNMVALQQQLGSSASSAMMSSIFGQEDNSPATNGLGRSNASLDNAAKQDLARKLAFASANGLLTNSEQQSDSADQSQLMAMCNLYQSRFVMNQLLPESVEEQQTSGQLLHGNQMSNGQLGAPLSANSSVQTSPGQQSDTGQPNDDDYGAESGAPRTAQLLLAN